MATTYLSKTFSAGNQKTWTWSFWTKIPNYDASNNKVIFSGYNDANNLLKIQFANTDQFQSYGLSGGTLVCRLLTNQLFRDYSAWYHIVYSLDTTQVTSTDRQKLWVNGEEVTSFSTRTDPSQNADLQINNTIGHQIGAANNADHYSNCMAHCHFIDGTRYDASAFGETDSDSGIWTPKTSPSVTYGTNGFFLKFGNAGSLGTDSSGNGNNFTVNGSGTQTLDTPSNVFATWNGVFNLSGTLSNGNNTYATSDAYGSQGNTATSTLGVSSGKYYAEFKHNGTTGSFPNGMVGVYYNPEKFQNGATNPAQSNDEGFGYAENGNIYNNSSTSTGTTYTTGDIIGVALDLDGSKVYWYKNGTLVNSGGTTIDAGETYFFFVADTSGSGGTTYQANFGNGYFGTTAVASAESDSAGLGKFEYSVPTGYYALCTKNIASYG